MAAGTRRAAAALLPLLLALACQPRCVTAATIDLPFEHAFGGGAFAKTGRLVGDLDEQGFGSLELQREGFSDAEKAAFERVARADGFYRVRVPAGSDGGGGNAYVLASLRARCLAETGFREQLTLHVGSDGSVSGLEYGLLSDRACPAGLPLAEASLAAAAPLPSSVPVAVRPPASAPHILLEQYRPATPGAQPGAGAAAPVTAGAPQQQQHQGSDGGGTGSKDGKALPVPDERTWLQKNWLFLLPLGLFIFNAVGGLAAPSSNAAASGAGGSGGAQ